MRFLTRLISDSMSREDLLAALRGLARTIGVEVRNPKWTSYGALEIDVFAPTRRDFDLFLSLTAPFSALEFIHDLNVAPGYRPEDELFDEARNCFNSERYWECHEILEGIWRTRQGEEKLLLQGIILVCAAFVHHQKGEDPVALGVLARAVKQLVYPAQSYHGIDLRAMSSNSSKILRAGSFKNFQV